MIIKVLCDNNRTLDAIYAEANDYLLKKTPPVRLLKAIAEVQAGGAPLMPAVVRQVLRLFPRPGAPARVPAGAHWAWWFLLGVLACSFIGPACTLN